MSSAVSVPVRVTMAGSILDCSIGEKRRPGKKIAAQVAGHATGCRRNGARLTKPLVVEVARSARETPYTRGNPSPTVHSGASDQLQVVPGHQRSELLASRDQSEVLP